MPIESMMEVGTRQTDPDYLGIQFTDEQIEAGDHRTYVGGRWEQLGKLQFDFLVKQGLRPEHKFIDVGCGSLRAGRMLVDYLEPGNYYGIDINLPALEIGYERELTAEQRERLPQANLRATDRFNADFGVMFDFGIAQSVFTHLALNYVRLCLQRAAGVMAPGGRFFATFYEAAPGTPLDEVRGGKYSERNAFWYYRRDMRWASQFGPFEFRYIGGWGHPTGQRMLEFRSPEA